MNKNLDFLRAFAVLLVAVGHGLAFFDVLGPYASIRLVTFGGIGVLLFFVHTSLVLMQSLEREPGAAAFLLRRIFRIYPLAILVIVAVVVFRIPSGSVEAHHFSIFVPDVQDLVANLSLTQSLSMRTPILGPTWSLAYEMQMYFLLPMLFAMTRSTRTAIGLYVASLAIAAVGIHYSATVNLSFFAPCFLSGVLAYQLGKGSGRKLPAPAWPLFVVLLVLARTMMADSHAIDFALCLALGVAIPRFAQISSPALTAASHYVAKYSYGIYLTHFAAIYFAFERLAGFPIAVRIAVFAALIVGLPVAFYHAIEEPFVRLGKSITRKPAAAAPKAEVLFGIL